MSSEDLRITLLVKRNGESSRRIKASASAVAAQRKYVAPLRTKDHRIVSQKVSSKYRSFSTVLPADSFSTPVVVSEESALQLLPQKPIASAASPTQAPFTSSSDYCDIIHQRESHQKDFLASCSSSLGFQIDTRGSNENWLSGFDLSSFSLQRVL
jgi:hypothetical protein